MRIIFSYMRKTEPHAGGFLDQPTDYVQGMIYLLSQVADKEKRDLDAQRREMEMRNARMNNDIRGRF